MVKHNLMTLGVINKVVIKGDVIKGDTNTSTQCCNKRVTKI